jgi:mono/diheme cytochrome c family protein
VRKIITGLLTIVVIAGLGAFAWKACAEDQSAPAPAGDQPAAAGAATGRGAAPAGGEAGGGGAAAGGECCKAGDTTPPVDLVKNTPKGGLHNPYNDKLAETADEGHKKFMGLSCNGCHGGGGGGGMCPPLTNDTWVYGPDDDTLFRLVTLGSDGLKQAGYVRKGSENVVGPMPPFGALMKSSDDLWKIIAWIRTVNPNSVAKVNKPTQ